MQGLAESPTVIEVDQLNCVLQTGVGINAMATNPLELLQLQNNVYISCWRARVAELPHYIETAPTVPFVPDELVRQDTLQLLCARRQHVVECMIEVNGKKNALYVRRSGRLFATSARTRNSQSERGRTTTKNQRIHQGDVTSIDLNLAIPGNAYVERINSDLLPEGAIGMVDVVGDKAEGSVNQAEVVTRQGNSSQIVQIRLQDNMTATKFDTTWPESYHTQVWFIPGVTCNITSDTNHWTVQENFNVNPMDDMVTIFLNGSGNVFVDASDSALYMDDVHFLAAGSGVLQVVVKELWSVRGVWLETPPKLRGISSLLGGKFRTKSGQWRAIPLDSWRLHSCCSSRAGNAASTPFWFGFADK
ncbi:hypothetical protein FI667_g9322, partial [Globisporangium splendens]